MSRTPEERTEYQTLLQQILDEWQGPHTLNWFMYMFEYLELQGKQGTAEYEALKHEEAKRSLQSQEGLVCIDCGRDILHEEQYYIGQCDDCLRWDIEHAGAEVDYWEDWEDGHVRLILRDTGECFSEYTL